MAGTPVLQGYDSYELRLGDELRGERASKGKTLMDVQRDLRIRADYIDAIENADAGAFPFAGFAAGYIRSYARYLDLDPDDVYRRFCAESGFGGVENGVSVSPSKRKSCERDAAPVRRSAEADGIQTRFMPSANASSRVELGASLRGLASIGVLGALVVGLGYGGWTVLQNLQRVGFAPLPTAPTVQVSAPDFFSPETAALPDAPAEADGEDGVRVTLAALYAEQEAPAPVVEPRDGPISSIDPARAGVYAAPGRVSSPAPADDGDVAGVGAVDHALLRAAVAADAAAETAAGDATVVLNPANPAEAALPPAPAAARSGVHVFATAEAWIRVRNGDSKVLFTGILGAGEHFSLPAEATAPQLRAGNAGAVYIVVDGAAFGPLGAGPEVAKNVSLTPDAVRAAYPQAKDVAIAPNVSPADDREASATAADGSAYALRQD